MSELVFHSVEDLKDYLRSAPEDEFVRITIVREDSAVLNETTSPDTLPKEVEEKASDESDDDIKEATEALGGGML